MFVVKRGRMYAESRYIPVSGYTLKSSRYRASWLMSDATYEKDARSPEEQLSDRKSWFFVGRELER